MVEQGLFGPFALKLECGCPRAQAHEARTGERLHRRACRGRHGRIKRRLEAVGPDPDVERELQCGEESAVYQTAVPQAVGSLSALPTL